MAGWVVGESQNKTNSAQLSWGLAELGKNCVGLLYQLGLGWHSFQLKYDLRNKLSRVGGWVAGWVGRNWK